MAGLEERSHVLTVPTRGKGFVNFTRAVAAWLESIRAQGGLLTVFVTHTSASLTIQENADPNVRVDLLDALERLAPEDHPYVHHEEGPDDMPSHIKSMLTSVSLSIPVREGAMTLGIWQGVYLIEHRTSPNKRQVVLSYIGRVGE
ncbi:secondary thiamine-phosphate synthase enzyme YjbQ [Methyloceanibacter stevinii]|uniref:secondary thiamine-phosphate synthase enzyme YjbQ n=1 Tax=Methyloceanibacter stevinii TaxID=1774970 RepID=UPI0009F2A1D1|nr:secondary thiamine-phosphate synthase enzyme YjbQ [Methyloceanibacter stevinii]